MENVFYKSHVKLDPLFEEALSIIDGLTPEKLQDPIRHIRANGRLMAFCERHLRRDEIRLILAAHLSRHHHLLPTDEFSKVCSFQGWGRYYGPGALSVDPNFREEFGQALKDLSLYDQYHP